MGRNARTAASGDARLWSTYFPLISHALLALQKVRGLAGAVADMYSALRFYAEASIRCLCVCLNLFFFMFSLSCKLQRYNTILFLLVHEIVHAYDVRLS